MGSVLATRPDGKLHVYFVPAGNEAVLIVTPRGDEMCGCGMVVGMGALATSSRPLLAQPSKGVDVAIGPGAAALWPGAQEVIAEQLLPEAVVRLDDAVMLTCPPAADGWVLSYGHFRALLPSTLKPEAQADLLAACADLHTTVFKAPGPGHGRVAHTSLPGRCQPPSASSGRRARPIRRRLTSC